MATYSDFEAQHAPQLQELSLPKSLWTVLYQKLVEGVLDGGDAFAIGIDEDETAEQRYYVAAIKDLTAACDVWLIDPAIMFADVAEMLTQLRNDDVMLRRIAAIMEVTLQHEDEEMSTEEMLNGVRARLHRYMYHFSLRSHADSEGMRYRYIMDELGSRFRAPALAASAPSGSVSEPVPTASHEATTPNVHIALFVWFSDKGLVPYSLVWPVRDISSGCEAVRQPEVGAPLYGNRSYWQHRFKMDTGEFDFYCQYQHIAAIVERHCAAKSDARVLIAGCGNSCVGVDMAAAGYGTVVNIDYADAVIERMRARHANDDALQWRVADITRMHVCGIDSDSFDIVVDKATLDALLIPDPAVGAEHWRSNEDSAAQQSVHDYLNEVYRALKRDTGVFVIITLRSPQNVLPLLHCVFDDDDDDHASDKQHHQKSMAQSMDDIDVDTNDATEAPASSSSGAKQNAERHERAWKILECAQLSLPDTYQSDAHGAPFFVYVLRKIDAAC